MFDILLEKLNLHTYVTIANCQDQNAVRITNTVKTYQIFNLEKLHNFSSKSCDIRIRHPLFTVNAVDRPGVSAGTENINQSE